MNYKGIKFQNNLTDFSRWCREFPPLETGTQREFAEISDGKNDYYCSCENVKMMGARFAGVTIRKYDEEQKNFEHVGDDEKSLFDSFVTKYKKSITFNQQKHLLF